MKILLYLHTALVFSIIFFGCEEVNPKKQIVDITPAFQTEKKYKKIISDSTNKLIDKIENLELEFTVWGCACPQWIMTEDNNNKDSTKNFFSRHFYLEEENKNLAIPIYFDAFRHRIKVQGKFYEREDYPQGTIEQEEQMPKAKVFQYSKIEVIDNPNFKPKTKVQTLILGYNAIACTCAQWSEKKYSTNENKKTYYWLEPANSKLIQADKYGTPQSSYRMKIDFR